MEWNTDKRGKFKQLFQNLHFIWNILYQAKQQVCLNAIKNLKS